MGRCPVRSGGTVDCTHATIQDNAVASVRMLHLQVSSPVFHSDRNTYSTRVHAVSHMISMPRRCARSGLHMAGGNKWGTLCTVRLQAEHCTPVRKGDKLRKTCLIGGLTPHKPSKLDFATRLQAAPLNLSQRGPRCCRCPLLTPLVASRADQPLTDPSSLVPLCGVVRPLLISAPPLLRLCSAPHRTTTNRIESNPRRAVPYHTVPSRVCTRLH
jgi:hypothetical protein